jgi:hypothetical protein
MGCCDPDTLNVYMLKIDGFLTGLLGVKEAFLNVWRLGLVDKEAAEKLLEIVNQKNYISEGAEKDYMIALFAEYKRYIVRFDKK